jgi:signal transduction histidine kinase
VVITALRDEAGRHIGFAKITRDLTEKRRIGVLEDEGKRMTTFLAMLGHELRNPLAPIANAVAILQLAPIESEQVRMCRDVIGRQVRQLTRLVDDLLDIGRITAGKIHLELAPVEVGGVLREAVEALQPAAAARKQSLELDLAGAPAWVDGDGARLLQVCQNLLNNAVKFTPSGGRIRACLRSDGTHVEISVTDNGPGIAPHRSNDVFSMFVQGEPGEDLAQDGLGVGLSLVQQLVTLHGGDISLFSTGQPGEGAEFVVRLVQMAPPPDAPSQAA